MILEAKNGGGAKPMDTVWPIPSKPTTGASNGRKSDL